MPEAICAKRICITPDLLLEQAALITEKGRVLDVTTREALRGAVFPVQDLGECTVVPAPLNAHAHLELSQLKGRTCLGQGFAPWVRSMMELGRGACPRELMQEAARQIAACGTIHVADVCSRQPEEVASVMEQGGIGVTLCAEIMGFAPLSDGALPLPQAYLGFAGAFMEKVAGAGHALYSTSPLRLQRAKAWSQERERPFSMHLAEHEEEELLLTQGTGPLAEMLRRRLLPRDWQPPGLRSVALAHKMGILGPDTLAVHCVRLSEADMRLLADSGTTVCLCPRSNEAIGVGQAPVSELLASGVPCCLGTDSLASNEDLDIWGELGHVLRRTRPAGRQFWRQVVELGAANAAKVLGLEFLGALTPGKAAAWRLVPENIERLYCP